MHRNHAQSDGISVTLESVFLDGEKVLVVCVPNIFGQVIVRTACPRVLIERDTAASGSTFWIQTQTNKRTTDTEDTPRGDKLSADWPSTAEGSCADLTPSEQLPDS